MRLDMSWILAVIPDEYLNFYIYCTCYGKFERSFSNIYGKILGVRAHKMSKKDKTSCKKS